MSAMHKIKPFIWPLEVLHILPDMQCGGVGGWLTSILQHSDHKYVNHHILYLRHEAVPYYAKEIEQSGTKIFRLSCNHHNVLKIQGAFQKVIEKSNPFAAIHSHCSWYNGIVMKIAAKIGIPIRISHIHGNVNFIAPNRKSVLRSIYIERMKCLIDKYATHGIACSDDAGKAFWGASWGKDPRWTTMFCGIDFTPFAANFDKKQIRKELGIPEDAFVIGHVGRFAEEKNHTFIIDVMDELLRLESKSILLLIGDGALQEGIRQKVRYLGLESRVIFAGVRSDIPRLLKGAMDCFLFPSLHEGMGLAGIEAQAAGIPCVLSDHIPLATEGNVVPNLIHPISLNVPAINWAKQIYNLQNSSSCPSCSGALNLVLQSKFNIHASLNDMIRLYCQNPDRVAA